MPPLVSRPFSGVTLCCLSQQGGCGTRPGKAHKTCLVMGLEQSSPTTRCRVELLGAPQGEQLQLRSPATKESQKHFV